MRFQKFIELTGKPEVIIATDSCDVLGHKGRANCDLTAVLSSIRQDQGVKGECW